jgi:hypothetical protein
MEVQLKENDIKIIDQFDVYIRAKIIELSALKKELKVLLSRCIVEFSVEGKSMQKVTYQSFYYHLKTTAEVLGIKNKELMNI